MADIGDFARAFSSVAGTQLAWRGHIPGPEGSSLLLVLKLDGGRVSAVGYVQPDVFVGDWSEHAISEAQSLAGCGGSRARFAELVLCGLGVSGSPPPYGAPSFAIRERRLVVTVAFGPDLLAELPATAEAIALPPAADLLVRALDAVLPAPPPVLPPAPAAAAAAPAGGGGGRALPLAGQKRSGAPGQAAPAAGHAAAGGRKVGATKFRVGYV